MAESVVTFLLKKLDTLGHEYVKLLGGIREDVGYVRDELERIRAFLRVADAKEEGDEEIKVWVKQVRDVAYDMEDVLDEFLLRFSHHGGRGFYRHLRKIALTIKNLKARHRIASGLQAVRSRVTTIAEGHQRYRYKLSSMEEWSSSSSVPVNNTWRDLRGDALLLEEAHLVGIDKPKRVLIGGLVGGRSELQVVAVAGMGGLGKTTLANKVYKDDVVKRHFQHHAWVTVSQRFKPEDLLKDIIRQLFDEMKQTLPQEADSTDNVKLKEFLAEQSWNLFCGKTFQGNQCPPYLEKICKNILKKCEGLPLAIVAVSVLFLVPKHIPEHYPIDPRKLIRFWIVEGFVQEKEGRIPEDVGEGYFNELVNRSLIQVVRRYYDGRILECRIHDLLREIILLKSKDQNFVAIFGEQIKALPERARRLSIHKPLEFFGGEYDFSSLRSLFWFDAKDDSIPSFSLSTFFNGGLRFRKVLDCRGTNIDTFPEETAKLYNLRYLSLRDTKVRSIPRSIGKLQNLETLDLRYTYVTELPNEILRLRRLRHILVYRYEKGFTTSGEVIGFKALGGLETLSFLQKLCYIEVNHGGASVMKSVGKLTQLGRYLRSLSLDSAKPDEVLNLQNISSPPQCLQSLAISGRLQILPHWIASLSNLSKLGLRGSGLQVDPFESLQSLPNLNPQGVGHFKFDRLRKLTIERGTMPCLEQIGFDKCKSLLEAPSGIETSGKALGFIDMPDEFLSRLRQRRNDLLHVSRILIGHETDGEWIAIYCRGIFSKLGYMLRNVAIEKGTMPCLEQIWFRSCKSLENIPSGIKILANLKTLELVDMSDEFLTRLHQRQHNDLLHVSTIVIGHETDRGMENISSKRYRWRNVKFHSVTLHLRNNISVSVINSWIKNILCINIKTETRKNEKAKIIAW
ncbi:hypothetical protein FNV43_RR08528 [Rhamnella rubrinervis]|uniref:Disease resistance protein RPM1 n=1 Tax=Rhamnella rubrinervis TaxID=2594499 RepID=A0A8K0H8H9_9ROSA|nr:hypothetical protein FNV43_RR08528 [Rhamnella rubrinervis]